MRHINEDLQPEVTTVILLRHGRTTANAGGVLAGWCGVAALIGVFLWLVKG